MRITVPQLFDGQWLDGKEWWGVLGCGHPQLSVFVYLLLTGKRFARNIAN